MDETSLLNWFREQLWLQVGVRKHLVTPAADFLVDLGLDSLDDMNLLLCIEEEFDIEILFGPESESKNFDKARTVGDAIHYVLTRVSNRSAYSLNSGNE